MRIIAGRFRGRVLKAPAGLTTRPTTDRVREATFSSMTSLAGADLGGGAVFDPFAGSGALALEALSRGCSHAVMVEHEKTALAAVRANVAALGVTGETTIIAGDALVLAQRGALPNGPYSLLLLDPPYRLDPVSVVGFIRDLLEHGSLTEEALIVWEHASNVSVDWPDQIVLEKTKTYNKTHVDIATVRGGQHTT
ncbi:MAG: 16S rRNA (guanine(966)-N(2))-methyltransferase RsmD [Coriobacteriia bacterium]|nr:16S rRNA (guanine(966)-N(2))-methyltransferase RsmD [Coriobacteriia bacterium]